MKRILGEPVKGFLTGLILNAALWLTPVASADEVQPSLQEQDLSESASVGAPVGPVAGPTGAGPLFEFSEKTDPIFLQYYGVLFGPGLKHTSAYQPTPSGGVDRNFPVQMKNFLGLGYQFTDSISLTPTAYWVWRPVMGQNLTLMDPFIRLANTQLINTHHFNLYGDLRVHFGVSSHSRQNDYITGFQTFQALSFVPDEDGQVILSLYGSARYNVFGKQGRGSDVELYLAPHLSVQVVPSIAFTLLYEMQAVHPFGARVGTLDNDGTDLQLGVAWELSPTVNLNPYVNVYPGDTLSLESSSFGMTLSWKMI